MTDETVSSALRMALIDWVSTRRDPDWARLVAVLGSAARAGHARRLLESHRVPLEQAQAVLAVRWPAGRAWTPQTGLSGGVDTAWRRARTLYGARPQNLTADVHDWDEPTLEDVFRYRSDPAWPQAVAASGWLAQFVRAAVSQPDVAVLLHADPRLAGLLPASRDQWALPGSESPAMVLRPAMNPELSPADALRVLRQHDRALASLRSNAYGGPGRHLSQWLVSLVEDTGDPWLAQRAERHIAHYDERLGVLAAAPTLLDGPPDGVMGLARLTRSRTATWALAAALDGMFEQPAQLAAAIGVADRFEGSAAAYVHCVQTAMATAAGAR